MQKILILLLSLVLLTGCTGKPTFRTEITEQIASVMQTVPVELNVGYEHLSNNTYGWGLKKNKNAPPEVPTEIVELITAKGGIYKDNEPKTLYLTFDEGYENGYTAQILDVLKRQNVPAAFFVTGPYLKKEKELIQRMVDEGHIVGNHTVNHPSMPSVKSAEKLKKEITDLADAFYEQTGQTMRFFRPPMGEYSERTLAITQELGYTTVFWSFAYRDWETNAQKGREYAYKQITEGVHDGAVLLLHAVSRDNAEALEQVITDLKATGYQFRSFEDFGNGAS